MITKQALLDLLLQQQKTISQLHGIARQNRLVDSKAINSTKVWAFYWKDRAEKAEDELIDLKLFGKTQPK